MQVAVTDKEETTVLAEDINIYALKQVNYLAKNKREDELHLPAYFFIATSFSTPYRL